jgi:hypothetical protein
LVEKKKKGRLKGVYENLKPSEIKLEITRLQNQLLDLVMKRCATRQEITSIAGKETLE